MTIIPSRFPFARLMAAIGSLGTCSSKRRALLAFLFGSVMSFAMPPYNCFPLLWICMPALLLILRATPNSKNAFVVGWCFAFGFLVFSLYWIAASMFVDLKQLWWAVPLSVVGLPALFALYYAFASVLARKIGVKGTAGALCLSLMWFLADYARGHMFTGFPWNLEGYAWSGSLPVLQSTSVLGIYGLTLVTLLGAFLPALFADDARKAFRLNVFALLIFVALALAGEVRLHSTAVSTVSDVRLRLVQPNIQQALKWQLSERDAYFQDLLALTSAPAEKPITHFIWPETASTYYLGEDAIHRQEIAMRIPASSTLLTGVIREEMDDTGLLRYYNSLMAVDGQARIVGDYDKSHLVPFGEFMPWRRFIPIKSMAVSGIDFSAGSGPRSLRVLGLPVFSPLICYEAIFPGAVTDPSDRPDFLLNITNDGWYGKTIGPYQHFAISRVRAVEEGLPLIRVANTGITASVDPLGRVVKSLGLGQHGFIDVDLSQPLPPTLFSRLKDGTLWLLFTLSFLLFVSVKHREKI